MNSADFRSMVSPAMTAPPRHMATGGFAGQPGAPPPSPSPLPPKAAPGALGSATAAPADPVGALQKLATDAANACGRLVQALRIAAGPNSGSVDQAAANLRTALMAVVSSAHPGQ